MRDDLPIAAIIH